MFPALAMVGLLLGANAITSTNSSYVRVVTDDSTVEEGSRFSVTALVNSESPVNAVDVTLAYDGDALEVLEVDRGQSVLTIWTEDPIVTDEAIILRGGTFRRGFIGEHELITIDFLANQAGQTEISARGLTLLAGDGSGADVNTETHPESTLGLFVYNETTDPEDMAVVVDGRVVTDLNGDGAVTLADVSAFMAAWHSESNTYDFNDDGQMTFRDFSIILADFFLR